MMTEATTARPKTDGREVKRPAVERSRRSRRPVDRLLPEAVLSELRKTVASADRITPKIVTELDHRFEIANQYGVSKRRLTNYLAGLSKAPALPIEDSPQSASGSARPSAAQPECESSSDGWVKKVHAHRRRQASVAAILDQTFGRPAVCSPDLWERRAYLMLVGLVYERLATNEDEISTNELVALAKVLAENRRAEARLQTQPSEVTKPATGRTGELPTHFGNLVRQVYGVNFQAPQKPADRNESPK